MNKKITTKKGKKFISLQRQLLPVGSALENSQKEAASSTLEPQTTTATSRKTTPPHAITADMFWTLHSCSSGSITALAWMKVLEWMNVDWSHRDAFADLSKCKQDHFHFPYTSKDTFVRLLNMMKYFITFRHDLDENNRPIIENDDWKNVQEEEERRSKSSMSKKEIHVQKQKRKQLLTTRMFVEHLSVLIERYYRDTFAIFPDDSKWEEKKLAVLEQLIHYMDPVEQTITVHDWLIVLQHVRV